MNMMAIDSSVFLNLCCKLVIVECSPTKGIVELRNQLVHIQERVCCSWSGQ